MELGVLDNGYSFFVKKKHYIGVGIKCDSDFLCRGKSVPVLSEVWNTLWLYSDILITLGL